MPVLKRELLRQLAKSALQEDAAFRDITTLDFIPEGALIEARICAKSPGVFCGGQVAREVFSVFDRRVSVMLKKNDGDSLVVGDAVIALRGKARSILSSERVALNFISRLSGIASMSRRASLAVKGTGIRILDTRKTTPLLRLLEKHAVKVGGGQNHRLNLSDQYLVKDNHIAVLKGLDAWSVLESSRRTLVPFEIEVEGIDELRRALSLSPDIVMLDNFSPPKVRQAVALLRRLFKDKSRRPLIELSGGVTLSNIGRYRIKGVDFISLGALTHSALALDFSLEVTKVHRR